MKNITTITKPLDHITAYGHRSSQIYDDWLDITEASLRMLPTHARSVAECGMLAEDTPEYRELWERLRKRYQSECFPLFRDAFNALLDVSYTEAGEPIWQDVVGTIYMAWGHPSEQAGQFFTPFELCQLIADNTVKGVEEEVRRRIKAAIETDGPCVYTLMGYDLLLPYTSRWAASHLLPNHVEHFEPFTISDPAVGSGGLLLAAASVLPLWMTRWGLVQFTGQDIDRTCVQMARINMMLYGLNGYGLKLDMAALQLLEAGREKLQPVTVLPDPSLSDLPLFNVREVA